MLVVSIGAQLERKKERKNDGGWRLGPIVRPTNHPTTDTLPLATSQQIQFQHLGRHLLGTGKREYVMAFGNVVPRKLARLLGKHSITLLDLD